MIASLSLAAGAAQGAEARDPKQRALPRALGIHMPESGSEGIGQTYRRLAMARSIEPS